MSISLSASDQFDLEYPEDLGERLAWLQEHLGVPRGRFLRLLGLPAAEPANLGHSNWAEVARIYPSQAERAEQLLTHYLSYFDYDSQAALEFARNFSRKVEAGELRLPDYVRGLSSAGTPAERVEALLCCLEEGPDLLPVMAYVLGTAEVET